jgi:eukaryotic-like serine/threonine-protein kinase
MQLASRTRLGPYEVLSPIGVGGMGAVYKARDTRLDRSVAIKVAAAQFSERFEREARAIAALNHPHICQIHDVGPDYLVMEYVDGEPLKGPLPVNKAVEYAGQILDALDAAHRKGIIHRDLKPANILVTKQGIKLLDFGLAKPSAASNGFDVSRTTPLTGEGQILGTLQYMSPEQLQGKEADERSDLFSFGCVLYEMLSGQHAFAGASTASVIAAILEREPVPLDTTPPLDRVIRTCLAKDPDNRIQTARDVKTALGWAVEKDFGTTPARVPRRWWITFAGTTLVFSALAGWALMYFRQMPANDRVLRLQIDPPESGHFVFGSNTVGGIALSPDGRVAAYVTYGTGKNGLWIQPLDGTARFLPGTEGAAYPFWSPDSKSIGFFTVNSLQRVDVAGGLPLTICEVNVGRGGAWSSDNRILFGTFTSALFEVSASGGMPLSLTTLDASRGEASHRFPQILPDRRFLYWVQSDKSETTGVYAASLSSPAKRVQLLKTGTNALYAPGDHGRSYLLWLRSATLVAQEFDPATLKLGGEPRSLADPVAMIGNNGQMHVAVSTGGILLYSASNTSSQFAWLNHMGKLLGTVGEPAEYGQFRLSPDGRRAAAARDVPGGTEIWFQETQRGTANRFAGRTGMNVYPVWSPDGGTVVWSSGSPRNLFRRISSGPGEEQRVSESPNNQFATDWSSDGRFILYDEITPGAQQDLWILPTTRGEKPKPYLRTQFGESNGRFSPDADRISGPRWVAYQSNESGRREVYIDSFPIARGGKRISINGGQFPQWGPASGVNGGELLYLSLDFKLMAVSLKIGRDSVEPSAPRELFTLHAVDDGAVPYDTSSNGNLLIRATPAQSSQPLNLIVNWPALLKKQR